MKFNFKDVFPLATIENADEYVGTCHFYFDGRPQILQECIDFINQIRTSLQDENSFALEKCRQENDYSKDCCKKYAKSNDMAYDLCVNGLSSLNNKNITRSILLPIVLGIPIIIITILIVISFFVRHK